MGIVKHISIHTQPLSFLQYIMNGDKNSDMKYATGINIVADPEQAYEEFRQSFERYSGERFFKKSLLDKTEEQLKREKIRLHHYIQSFKPDEVSPEEAHSIGIEWAKKVFGTDRKVIVSTHIDRDHIHNHIAVAPYDNNGKKWNDNMKTLNQCRRESDEICKAHGLYVIKNPKRSKGRTWGEYLAWKTGRSWKARIADLIDSLIADKDVHSVEDLIHRMEQQGYQVKYRKYITFKVVPGVRLDKGFRSHRLGDGYQADEIAYRIAHKENELSEEKINSYTGTQREYALYLRELNLMVFRKKENTASANFSDLVKSADVLNYIVRNNITSREQFTEMVNKSDDKVRETEEMKKQLTARYKEISKVVDNSRQYLSLISRKLSADEMEQLRNFDYMGEYGIYSEDDVTKYADERKRISEQLVKLDEDLETAKREKSEISKVYTTYITQIASDEYVESLTSKHKMQKEEITKGEQIEEMTNGQNYQFENEQGEDVKKEFADLGII